MQLLGLSSDPTCRVGHAHTWTSYGLYGARTRYTMSPQPARHRQVVKHDALLLTGRRSHKRFSIEARAHCHRHHNCAEHASVRKMAAKNRCSGKSAAFSAQLPTVAQNSEYLLKVCCLGMVNMKSGSLTPKGLHFLFLRPGDLKNGYFALF